MRATGQHRFALICAIMAMTPAAALGATVDAQTTAAIPPRPGAFVEAGSTAAGSVAVLKSGLDALSARNIARARSVRDSLPPASLDRHILAWAIALRGGNTVPSGEIAAAAQALPAGRE